MVATYEVNSLSAEIGDIIQFQRSPDSYTHFAIYIGNG